MAEKKTSKNIIEATITASKTEVETEKKRLAAALSHKNPIPGFRPGHAPANLVAEKYGLEEFNREVATNLIRGKLLEHVIKTKIEPVIDPKIKLEKFDDELVFTVVFTTKPEVTVGEYKKLKAKKPKPEKVNKDEIEKIITNLHEKQSSTTPVDESGEKYILDANGNKIPLGKSKQGPLNDDFAKQFGVKDLNELREKIKDNLTVEKVRNSESQFESNLLESLVKITKIDLPYTLVEAEVVAMISRLESQIKDLGADFETYLKSQNKTQEELAKDFEENAKKTLKASLALDKIATQEKFTVTDEEIKSYFPADHVDHPEHAYEEQQFKTSLLRQKALSYIKSLVK